MNIDAGSREDAENFTRSTCSRKIFQKIRFIEQPDRPGPIMMALEEEEHVPEYVERYLEPGCKLFGVDKSKIPPLLSCTPPKRNIADAFRKVTGGTSCGSLACFAVDEDGVLHGITAKHIFDKKKSLVEIEEPKRERFEGDSIHSISEVIVPQTEQQIERIEHFSDYIHAMFEDIEINGDQKLVDIAIVRLTQNAKNSPHLRKHFRTKDDKPAVVETCDMDDDEIIGKLVQKTGFRTGFTEGKIADSDYEYNLDDDLYGGLFVVIPIETADGNAQSNIFADSGDSGSLVVDLLKEDGKNQAYGLCFHSHNNFIDENNIQHPKALLCVRLNHCLAAIQSKFNKEMKLCNPPHPQEFPQSGEASMSSMDKSEPSTSKKTDREKVPNGAVKGKERQSDEEINNGILTYERQSEIHTNDELHQHQIKEKEEEEQTQQNASENIMKNKDPEDTSLKTRTHSDAEAQDEIFKKLSTPGNHHNTKSRGKVVIPECPPQKIHSRDIPTTETSVNITLYT